MSYLKRIQVGDFNIKDAITIEELEKGNQKNFIFFEDLFKDKKIINLDNRKLKLFLNGVKLNIKLEEQIYRIYNNEKFIGTGIVKDNILKRDIIL